jgi:DNA-binding NarL/FixJ family response regulator
MNEQAESIGEVPPLGVVIVEDDPKIRKMLSLLLRSADGLDLLAQYGSVEQILASKPIHLPNVVLLDIGLPGIPGDIGVRDISARFPEATVLMLTIFEDEDRIFRSLCNGAGGYLLKRSRPDELLAGIREAGTGGAPMSPEIARKVVGLFSRFGPPPDLGAPLTAQETQFLALLAEGYSYQKAADELGVSINSIRNYVRSVYEKLHVHTKSEAVTKALKAGLI